ncbi:MAG: 50S ribosomal protein L1 [Candidatus Omnitrophica bacterium]|nr:50S ribosomal protein L1 [Candidatus Omnitrophota bacterium]
MKKRSKRYSSVSKDLDKDKKYFLEEAVSLLKKMPSAKFDENIDLSFHMGVDIKQTDQFVRGSVALPHGTGKTVKILVFCKGETERAAKEAGADYVGNQELIDKITSGWLDFDVSMATPDMMRDISRLGKIMGPRGLMPNPKSGTVTNDIAKAINDFKKGKVEFKMDKAGNVGVRVGKASFDEKKIYENAHAAIEALMKAKPATVKGQYVKNAVISRTMSPGIKLDHIKLSS